MSVRSNQYIIYGVCLPFPDSEELSEKYSEYGDSAYSGITHKNGLVVLTDSYDGKYTVIGRALEKSEEGQAVGDGVVQMPDIDPAMKAEVMACLLAEFQITDEPKMLLVTHYR